MKTLLLGCGFVGKVLAQRLIASGHSVTGWIRNPEQTSELSSLGITPYLGDITEESCWNSIPRDFECVIHIASSSRGDAEVYKKIYLQGMQRVCDFFPKVQKVFVSSTSVYGQTDGEWVDETSPTTPSSATSQVLLQAEAIALQHQSIVVRPSGIYGPQRSVLYRKFVEGTAVIEGTGTRWINQIHRDDVAAGIAFLIQKSADPGIYNLTDDHPTCSQELYKWLSQKLQQPLPPHAPENTQRKRGWTHKRISNQKIKSLGWTPQYPSFCEGYETVL